ncbi:SDR family NAD(P)-dependent oxidoreductase [Streptomyces iconiensis]|uniref:SDR family NAD(P)-dependent oxidoreductase n=1 Tax=Streptomyces iconiensis TaxID=1384038 RepID=A0ABT7A1F8_9ACTN|nr:SDR family NAD(P)-dependent oxidoreductase [Streptomyces iconiensis]MDJ1135149.1 SDR family NAD(P)-dependent oxidoreductase [Streptomyces iconiensis]
MRAGGGARRSLGGPTCLVTGGAGGTGWAVSNALAHAGAEVHLADVAREKLHRVDKDGAATSITPYEVDVANRPARTQWVEQVGSASGRDIPARPPVMYRLYALAPGSLRRLTAATGSSRRDHAGPPHTSDPMDRA